MAKVPTLRAGELTTTHYGWVKPTVGASIDAWGGYINTDLDDIDTVVHGIDTRVIPPGVALVSDTPPVGPTPGMLWFDSVGGQTYVWYSDANSSRWAPSTNQMAAATDDCSCRRGWRYCTQQRQGEQQQRNADDQRNNGASGTAIGYTVDRCSILKRCCERDMGPHRSNL